MIVFVGGERFLMETCFWVASYCDYGDPYKDSGESVVFLDLTCPETNSPGLGPRAFWIILWPHVPCTCYYSIIILDCHPGAPDRQSVPLARSLPVPCPLPALSMGVSTLIFVLKILEF